jgi:hypothetical protein
VLLSFATAWKCWRISIHLFISPCRIVLVNYTIRGKSEPPLVHMSQPHKRSSTHKAGRKQDFGEVVPSRISVPFEMAQRPQKKALVRIWQGLQEEGLDMTDLHLFLDRCGVKVIHAKSSWTYRMYSTAVPASFGAVTALDADAGGYEEVDLRDILLENPERTILLKVIGTSMIDEGIYPESILAVETPNTTHKSWLVPNDRDIVIALIDGSDLTVKQFRNFPKGSYLVPRSQHRKELAPRIVDEDVKIIGIVKAIIQKL